MCKSITHFPTQRGESSLGCLAGQRSRPLFLSTDCPSWHVIIHGNSASHSSNGDIMKLVKTSPLSQQDRRQHRMETWLTDPKADAFWFLTAPGGGWWLSSPKSSSWWAWQQLILIIHLSILFPWTCFLFESEFVEEKKKPHKARICGWAAVYLTL